MVCQGMVIRFYHQRQKGWQITMEERIYEEEMTDNRIEDIYAFLSLVIAVGYIMYKVFDWMMYI